MKYYIIAGEASGDLHGGNLMRELLARDPEALIRYWGGDNMAQAVEEAGAERHAVQVRHIRDLAFMGIVEVVSHLSSVLGNIRFCKRDIVAFNPDVVVFIDYPGFNLKIAKFTHSKGFRNVYYISPQIWAWKKGRIRPMRRTLDKLCYILPTEQKFYAENNFPQAVYVGHPLLDEVERYRQGNHQVSESVPDGSAQMQMARPMVALLPGSRKQELQRLLPTMVKLARNHPDMNFTIAGMSLIGEEFYQKFIPADVKNVFIGLDATYRILSQADAAVVCSGTATLETALFRVPQVVCYQCNKISAAIARQLIASRISYISLVNLIADKPVVSELIQSDFDMERLEQEFSNIANNNASRDRMLSQYDEMIALLGGTGASARTAEHIIEMAKKGMR